LLSLSFSLSLSLSLSLRDKKEYFYILYLGRFNSSSHDSNNKFIIYNNDFNCQLIGEGNVTFWELALLTEESILFQVSKVHVLMKMVVHTRAE
jgi:hypothetical protein